jgi:hypothetical protein
MSDAPPLSPAESLLLLDLTYSSRQAVRVTLLELVAQKVLRVDTQEEPGIVQAKKVQHLRVLVPQVPNMPNHIASLMDTLNLGRRDGMDMDSVTKLLLNRYGSKVNIFKEDLVLPTLVARGLLAEQRFGLFWLGKRFAPTHAGEAERKRLNAAVEKAREIPELLKTAPAKAAAFALASGRAILLVDRLTFELRELGEAIRKHRDSGAKLDFESSELASYDLERVDKATVHALDYCLKAFDLDLWKGTGVVGGA